MLCDRTVLFSLEKTFFPTKRVFSQQPTSGRARAASGPRSRRLAWVSQGLGRGGFRLPRAPGCSAPARPQALPRPGRRRHRPDNTDVELVLAKAPPGAGQKLLAPQIGPAPRPGLGRLVGRRRRGQRERRLPTAQLLGLEVAGGVALLPQAGRRGRAAAATAQQQAERRGLRLASVTELGLHAGQAAEEARTAAARGREAQGPARRPSHGGRSQAS